MTKTQNMRRLAAAQAILCDRADPGAIFRELPQADGAGSTEGRR